MSQEEIKVTNAAPPEIERETPSTVYLGQVLEHSGKLKITGVKEQLSNIHFDSTRYVIFTKNVYEVFLQMVNNYPGGLDLLGVKTIYYVELGTTQVTSVDQIKTLPIVESDNLQIVQNLYLTKAREALQGRTETFQYNLFKYMKYGTELAAKGYFISDSNRQDKYEEILSSEDDDAVNSLLSYLQTHDALSFQLELFSAYQDLVVRIELSSSEEECQRDYESFITLFS